MKTDTTIEIPANPRLTAATLPYEVRGSNESLIVCHATSPEHAIDLYNDSFPDERFDSIECLRPQGNQEQFQRGQWVLTEAGDLVAILRSQLIYDKETGTIERHYETSLGHEEWFAEGALSIYVKPEDRKPQMMEAIAA